MCSGASAVSGKGWEKGGFHRLVFIIVMAALAHPEVKTVRQAKVLTV